MRHVRFPPNLPLARRSSKDSKSKIDARMPTPYAFSGPLTFGYPAGYGDETEDTEPKVTEEVLMASNGKTERAEDSEFDATEEDLMKANNGQSSCQETQVEVTKIILTIGLGNTLKSSAEFNNLPRNPNLEAAYLAGKSEVFFNKIYSAAKIAALEIISPQLCAEQCLNLTSAVEKGLKEMNRTDATGTEELLAEGDGVFLVLNIDDSRPRVPLKRKTLSFAGSNPAEFLSLVKDNFNNIICFEVAAHVTITRPPMSSKELENEKLKIHHSHETTEGSSTGESVIIQAE